MIGRFVPNKLTPDSNSNRRLDILRCPLSIEISEQIYANLTLFIANNQSLIIEIYKSVNFIIKFQIPFKTRVTGYMLEHPNRSVPSAGHTNKHTQTQTQQLNNKTNKTNQTNERNERNETNDFNYKSTNIHTDKHTDDKHTDEHTDEHTEDTHLLHENNNKYSKFNVWNGYQSSVPPTAWTYDKISLCVPGLETAADKLSLPLYLEFIEYHLQLGVSHIFLGWFVCLYDCLIV